MKHLNTIVCGDCRDLLKELPDNSVDALVTDPPYGLGFMGKEWDTLDKSQFGQAGLEGKGDLKVKKNFRILPRYQPSGIYLFMLSWATEALRVLKPGAHALVFGGTRTEHRMKCALEDAGFEIRDTITWLYGSGFPKSHNIGKAADKTLGNEREIVGERPQRGRPAENAPFEKNTSKYPAEILTKGNSEWEGWGTALKPAVELICLARKPLSERNIVENVLKHGTAGLNIDGSRVGTEPHIVHGKEQGQFQPGEGKTIKDYHSVQGRWPANLILGCACEGEHEPGCAVRMLDEQSGTLKSGDGNRGPRGGGGMFAGIAPMERNFNSDSGGASRFFYCAKSSRRERNMGLEGMEPKQRDESRKEGKPGGDNPRNRGVKKVLNAHPTVKPLKLMEYLVRLITPPGGIVLDPFIGSGTTAMACKKLGFDYIGFEKEREYVEIAKARVAAIERGLF